MAASALVNSYFPQQNLPPTQGFPVCRFRPISTSRHSFYTERVYQQLLTHLCVEFRFILLHTKDLVVQPWLTASRYSSKPQYWPRVLFNTFCPVDLPNAWLLKKILSWTLTSNWKFCHCLASFANLPCASLQALYLYTAVLLYADKCLPSTAALPYFQTWQLLKFLKGRTTSSSWWFQEPHHWIQYFLSILPWNACVPNEITYLGSE